MVQTSTTVGGAYLRPAEPSRTLGAGAGVEFRPPNRAVTARRLSVASAAAVLVAGYVHLCLYRHGYRVIPKIGISFLLQASSSVLLAIGLLVFGRSIRPGRRSLVLAQWTRLSAIALSLGTLAALAMAHTRDGLFQFRELGLRPAPQTIIAIVTESVAAVLLLIAVLEGRLGRRLGPSTQASSSRVPVPLRAGASEHRATP